MMLVFDACRHEVAGMQTYYYINASRPALGKHGTPRRSKEERKSKERERKARKGKETGKQRQAWSSKGKEWKSKKRQGKARQSEGTANTWERNET